jgi:membrane protein implicated in regulation of membrane protease activity
MMSFVLFLLGLSLLRVLSLKEALPLDIVIVVFWGFILRLVWKDKRRKVTTGIEGMIGSEAKVIERNNVTLKVFFRGEIWDAVSSEDLSVGERVEILGIHRMERMKLWVGRSKDSVPKGSGGAVLGEEAPRCTRTTTENAVKANKGFRAASVTPFLKDGHPMGGSYRA